MEINNTPNPETNNQAEEFFKKIVISHYPNKEEFLDAAKLKGSEGSDKEILRMKGTGFEHNGKFYILMRTDVFPSEYLPYVETHEKWEMYLAYKKGYNLWEKSIHNYQKDKNIDLSKEKDWKEFYKNISEYNYGFHHEYAVYKEYEHAQKDGKLDEYYNWLMKLREKEKQTSNKSTLRLIENDIQIRRSIYKKIKEGKIHLFLRK